MLGDFKRLLSGPIGHALWHSWRIQQRRQRIFHKLRPREIPQFNDLALSRAELRESLQRFIENDDVFVWFRKGNL
jgi:hypothetical protein